MISVIALLLYISIPQRKRLSFSKKSRCWRSLLEVWENHHQPSINFNAKNQQPKKTPCWIHFYNPKIGENGPTFQDDSMFQLLSSKVSHSGVWFMANRWNMLRNSRMIWILSQEKKRNLIYFFFPRCVLMDFVWSSNRKNGLSPVPARVKIPWNLRPDVPDEHSQEEGSSDAEESSDSTEVQNDWGLKWLEWLDGCILKRTCFSKWLGWLFYLSWHVFHKKNEMDSRNCWACTRTLVIGDWLVGKCQGLKEMWFHEESAHIFSFKTLFAFPVSLAKKCVLHEQCQNPSFGLV